MKSLNKHTGQINSNIQSEKHVKLEIKIQVYDVCDKSNPKRRCSCLFMHGG